MLLRHLAQAVRRWVFFSHRVTLPNMSPTLISGVRGVTCYDEALAMMGVFFARTGPRHSGDFIIAAVVADIHDFWECTNYFYCPWRPAGNARSARRGMPAAPGGECPETSVPSGGCGAWRGMPAAPGGECLRRPVGSPGW